MPAKKKLANLKAKAKSAKAVATKARANVRAKLTPKLQRNAARAKALATKAGAKVKAAVKTKRKGVTPVPEGFHTITANLTVSPCAEAIRFYERALGAKEISRMGMPGSDLVWHCHLKIGDSNLFLNDPMPGAGPASSLQNPSPVSLFLYVEDCDAAFARALDAGMKVTMPMMDAFWGDRMGGAIDPYGNTWSFATRKKILTEAELMAAGEAFAREQASMAQPALSQTAQPGANGTQAGGARA